ncbi:leucine-rich repeat domain-containing protein [Mycoplasma enhydrae]|uniref:leucine-rich repeat domain-containing protein n=1 Tax=Mycoplasma enhydrae TaxID=2499220 RepID=UPI0021E8E3B4|nr:leucine-rich repeat domain-containing protein [Mycoplasma enhydrae]MCV3733516.1 leucine-rich repeat domain-containing protein [Mycoplasma enhydrae]
MKKKIFQITIPFILTLTPLSMAITSCVNGKNNDDSIQTKKRLEKNLVIEIPEISNIEIDNLKNKDIKMSISEPDWQLTVKKITKVNETTARFEIEAKKGKIFHKIIKELSGFKVADKYYKINDSNLESLMNDGYIIARRFFELNSNDKKFSYSEIKGMDENYVINNIEFVLLKAIPKVDSINWVLKSRFSTFIKDNSEENNTKIAHLKLANAIKIGNDAFANIKTLKSVDMPNVVEIGDRAFSGDIDLITVNMPKVERIGLSTFDKTEFLMNLIVSRPDRLAIFQNILIDGKRAFGNIILPNEITFISAEAFKGSNIDGINMPNVVEIGKMAFLETKNLKSVNMPKVNKIGFYAFSNTPSLETINVPNVVHIANFAFSATKLEFNGATLPQEITKEIFDKIKDGKPWTKS